MVRIITDSAADFEPFELETLKIDCIPIKVMVGETEYEENPNLPRDEEQVKQEGKNGKIH